MSAHRWRTIRLAGTALLSATVMLSGCGGSSGSSSADEYYAEMSQIGGKFADMSEEDLDKVGKAFCGDIANMDDDATRKFAPLAVRQDVDTDANAIFAVRAMVKRWCPEYSSLYDS